MIKNTFLGISKYSIAAIIAVGSLISIDTFSQDNQYVEEVVTLGTRGKPRSVSDSPVPVDVLSSEDISKTGTDDLLMQLQGSIPSLNVHLQPISDAASMIRPGNLRGLSSDATLIFTNGKRRHHASVIAFQGGGVNDGSQGADISVIPAIALKRIEVLRDGASAQYGSDAIAGVINFVLDDISEGGQFSIKQGEFSEGDGSTNVIAGKYGMPLGSEGFVTTSFQIRQADPTSRSQQRPDAASLIAGGNTAVANPAQIWGSPIVDNDVTFFMNSGVVNSDGSESYMFGNYSERDIDGGFYYRNPDGRSGVFTQGSSRLVGDIDGTCAHATAGTVDPSNYALRDTIMADTSCFIMNQIAPGGYTPRFIGNITDTSLVIGRKGDISEGMLAGHTYDLSGSVGRNEADFGLNNTVNPSMGPDTPRNFYTGSYIELEKGINLDLTKVYDSVTVAYGLEWREETFEVISGEESSWKAGKYALQGFNVGSHGFAGFSPDSQGAFSRRSIGYYLDVENQVSDDALIGGSVRHEDYTTFGTTTDYKINGRLQVNDNVALRGSFSTGFRAPTQGQVNVVNTQTTLVDGQLTQAQTLPGFKLGAGQLKPEEATNSSVGIVYDSGGPLSVTADFFNIEFENRVALTSNAAPTAAQVAAMGAAGIPSPELIGQVNYFTNDFDTETSGFDVIAVYSTELFGTNADISAAWNHTETEVTNSGAVTGASKVKRLEEGLPEDRMTFTVAQSWDNLTSFVRANFYGEYYAVHADWFGTDADAEWTVDAELTYQMTDKVSVSAGVQNLFDTEALKIHGSSGAVGEGVPGNVLGGIYYETSPYGIEGAYWYVKAGYNF
jgi:iron complex outermembrane receptor protein